MFSRFTVQNSTYPPPPFFCGPVDEIDNGYGTIFSCGGGGGVDHKVSGEAIHQIGFRYSKELSRYLPLVPSTKGVGEWGAAGACAPALSKVGGHKWVWAPHFWQTKCSNLAIFSYFVVKKCKIFLARFARQLYFIDIFKP